MKNKRGFTLIELLAVIVILAIIALIATPIVMNVIDNAKKGSAERSIENYLHAVEIAIMEARMNGTLEDGIYIINEDGSIQYKNNKINVDISTNNMTSGIVTITNGEITGSTINTEETTLIYDENGKKEFGVWDGTTEVIEESEDGYHITNAKQLAWLSEQVSNGTTFAGETIYLDVDIDLNNIEWTPIGRSGLYFKGTFEGNNHTIINIKVSKTQDSITDNMYIGLFGYVREATIRDLNIFNTNIVAHSRVGVIAGIARASTISNINIFNSNVTCVERCGVGFGYIYDSTNIKDMNVYNSVITGDEMIGGMIGVITSSPLTTSLENLKSYATIIGESDVGGIIGRASQGLLILRNVYSNGNITGTSKVGGIIGGFAQDATTELQYFNLVSEATLNTEYQTYNNLFGYKDTKTTLTQLNN